jgi:hypothetical protein
VGDQKSLSYRDAVNLDVAKKLLLYTLDDIKALESRADHLIRRSAQLRDVIRLGELLQQPSSLPASEAEQAAAHQAEDPEHIPVVIPQEDTAAAIADELFGSAPVVMRAKEVSATRQAQELLEEVGRPMRVKEIYEVLSARGSLQGKARRDTLRTSLRDRTDLFVRTGYGMYGLRAKAKRGVA